MDKFKEIVSFLFTALGFVGFLIVVFIIIYFAS
nr:MAG TPA: hypothetical protein [Bacteriophage sp.]